MPDEYDTRTVFYLDKNSKADNPKLGNRSKDAARVRNRATKVQSVSPNKRFLQQAPNGYFITRNTADQKDHHLRKHPMSNKQLN